MTPLAQVLGQLGGYCGKPLSRAQMAIYLEALTGFPIELVTDEIVAWERRNAAGSKLPSPVEIANACRDMQRGTWRRQKDESPTMRDLERGAKSPKALAALAFMRAMVDPGRTPATKREAARRMRADYGDTYRTICRKPDCVHRGPTGGCMVHTEIVAGPWVAMSEAAA